MDVDVAKVVVLVATQVVQAAEADTKEEIKTQKTQLVILNPQTSGTMEYLK